MDLVYFDNFRILSNIKKIQPLLKWYDTFNLSKLSKIYAKELSGGERQRVTLARALVNDPAIVWADEPTGNLDSENERLIMDLLTKMNKENNQTFVIVTHSEYVGGRTNRIIQMKDGVIV